MFQLEVFHINVEGTHVKHMSYRYVALTVDSVMVSSSSNVKLKI